MCSHQRDGWSCGIRAVCCFRMYLQGKLCAFTATPGSKQHSFLRSLETLDTSALSNFPDSYISTLKGLSKTEGGIFAKTNDLTITESTVPTLHVTERPPDPATSTVGGRLSTAHSSVDPPSSESDGKTTAINLHHHLSWVTMGELEHHLPLPNSDSRKPTGSKELPRSQ